MSAVCCRNGSFGTKHHSEKLIGQPAKARYDWYMLAAALLISCTRLVGRRSSLLDGHCPTSKVVAAFREVHTES